MAIEWLDVRELLAAKKEVLWNVVSLSPPKFPLANFANCISAPLSDGKVIIFNNRKGTKP